MGVIVTWIPQFLRDEIKGLGVFETGVVGAVATAGGVIGTVIIGQLANRFGHIRTTMACTYSTILMVYLLALYSSFTLVLVPHLFIVGVTTFSIPSLLRAYLAGISTSSQRDVLLGLYFTFGFSLWSTMIGKLVDIFSFSAAWTLISVLGLAAFFMLFFAYRRS